MLLALDTSSLVLSCAVAKENALIAEWTLQRKLTHSEQLIPHMEAMLAEAGVAKGDISAVAASKGPGSFTGLRIGLATAKVLAYVWKIPLIGVDTLEALAWNVAGAQAFALALTDAQRGRVYAALYSVFGEVWQATSTVVAPVEDVIDAAVRHGGPILAVGEAADMYQAELETAGIRVVPPHHRICRAGSVAMAAQKLWKAGKTDNPLTLVPQYIRRSEAEVLWEKRNGVTS